MKNRSKPCANCGDSFTRNPNYSDKQWGLALYCSRRCAARKNVAPVLERFFSFVTIDPITRCWNWNGAKDQKGYGFFDGERAHRQSYRLCVGDIDAGKLVLHRCDNRPCVNPFHLFIGTAQDNTDDMQLKGRARILRGEDCSSARLTVSEVSEIRKDPRTQDEIAAAYGIAQTTVSAIKRMVNWSYLPS